MSKKLRNVRRELSGYKETPAPTEKQKSFKMLKERIEGDGRALSFTMDFENHGDGLLEALRGMWPNERTFFDSAAMRRAEQQADDSILYGTQRHPGSPHIGGTVTGRTVGRTAMQALAAGQGMRIGELPAVLSAPEHEIDFGSLSPRQAAQMLEYSQRGSAQGILAAYRQAYGDRLRTAASRPEVYTPSRRDGFHQNDVSFVSVMREAARREGWDLARPRNVVPTGLSNDGLVAFRRAIAGIGEDLEGKDCLFLGFGPTRTLALIAGPSLAGAARSAWCVVLSPIPFKSTRVEVYWHELETRPGAPPPVVQARRAAFELFQARFSRVPAW